jgi:dolichol-phosphate mannosyltransferase
MGGDWLSVIAQMIAGVAALRMILRAARRRPPLAESSGTVPSITVVIPARNEASRLPECLSTIIGANGVTEVIVVDDCSEDETALVARNAGATVVNGAPLPEGWVGKVWALHQGVAAATGEWVVMLDADTRVSAKLPAAMVSRAIGERCNLLSAAGKFECPTWGARFLHPAMLTTLVYRYGPTDWRGTPKRNKRIANGQCMAMRTGEARTALETVKSETIEDVALARSVESSVMVDASNMLTTRMYENFGSTYSGWGRSLSLASVESKRRLWWHLFVVFFAQVLPTFVALFWYPSAVTASLVLLRIGTLFGTRSAYTKIDLAYWLSPFADVVAWWALVVGVARRDAPENWRGRTYR